MALLTVKYDPWFVSLVLKMWKRLKFIVRLVKCMEKILWVIEWYGNAWKLLKIVRSFGWEQFEYPPYSLNLTPSDYHMFLFLHLKKHLGSLRHKDDDEVKITVFKKGCQIRWQTSMKRGFKNWLYDKCLNIGRHHVKENNSTYNTLKHASYIYRQCVPKLYGQAIFWNNN